MKTTTEIATVDHLSHDQLAQELDNLRALSTEDLRRELARSLRMTAESLVRLALIVRSLEERGDDLSDLKIGLMPYLRQIAYGQVLPEVVMRYAEQPMLVRAISALPFPDQEHLSNGGKVAMALRHDDGSLDHRLVDPLYMDRKQVRLVFARGRIRPPEEQIVLIESGPRPAPKLPPTESLGGIKIDYKRRGLVIGRRFASAATVTMALAKLAAPTDDDDVERTKSVPVPLTDAEHRRLKTRSAETDIAMTDLIRRALRASGLI